jgi:glycosyltransferase involved in cell wall biosynthesis
MSDVSVIVSTYNRPRALSLVLDGLAKQTVTPAQIIIADDGSGPETEAIVRARDRQGLPLEHCWHSDSGFRKTVILNQAIRQVRTNYLIFLDGDCIPARSYIETHLELSAPRCLLAGTRVLLSRRLTHALERGVEDCHDRSTWFWLSKRATGDINQWLPHLRLPNGEWRCARPKNWRLVRGCNFSLATKDLLQTGGFDETILGWGREDSELAVRLINSGLRVKWSAFSAPVFHLWHSEERRDAFGSNDEILQQTIAEGRLRARRGIASSPPNQFDTKCDDFNRLI